METTLAILMALGIYAGVPIVIGLVIGGTLVMADHRTRRTKETRVGKETNAVAEVTVK